MKTIIAALIFVLVASPAFAARAYDSDNRMRMSKGYIGVSGGQNKVVDPSITTSTTAYSIFAGYAFNNFVAAELAYTNFGSLDLGSSSTLTGNAASLSAVGTLPLGKVFSVFGKVGYANTSTIIDVSGTALPAETVSGATYGAGFQFNMGHRASVRISYDSYNIMFSTVTYRSNLASLGLLFKF